MGPSSAKEDVVLGNIQESRFEYKCGKLSERISEDPTRDERRSGGVFQEIDSIES